MAKKEHRYNRKKIECRIIPHDVILLKLSPML